MWYRREGRPRLNAEGERQNIRADVTGERVKTHIAKMLHRQTDKKVIFITLSNFLISYSGKDKKIKLIATKNYSCILSLITKDSVLCSGRETVIKCTVLTRYCLSYV